MNINEFIEKLLCAAGSAGFEDYEAYASAGESFQAMVHTGEISDYKVSTAIGVSFRAIVDGKVGYASTQALDDDSIVTLIESAKSNAQISESKDPQFLFDGKGEYAALPGKNTDLEKMETVDKIALALELERCALAMDERIVQTDRCAVATISSDVIIRNSKGLNVRHGDNAIQLYISVVAKDGNKTSTGSHIEATRNAQDIDIQQIAALAVEQALDGLQAESVPSGKYKVMLDRSVSADLLETFAAIFSAESAQRGLSLLKGREGDVIASNLVTVVDDPHHPTALGSSPFDAEGLPTYKKQIIDRGLFKTLMHNLKTAAKQGEKSTANAAKASYASPIGISASNLYIEPADSSAEELMVTTQNGLFITEVQGLYSGANSISGDFSVSAKGYCICEGKKGKPVEQITLSGNYYELLKTVSAVGNDLKFGFPGPEGCVGSPSILVESLAVAGED